MTKFKIKETYLLMLIVVGLISLGIYTTYAMFTASTTLNDVVGITTALDVGKGLTEYEVVTVGSGKTKLIELNIVNSYSSSIYYGAWYQIVQGSSSDIDIGLYTEKNSNPSSGSLATNGSINLLAGVTNNGTSSITVYIGAKGSLTNELNLGNNKTLLPSGFSLLNGDLIIDSFKVDGVETTSFPLSSGYDIDTTCSDANITFDYKSQRYKVSNITKDSKAKCGFNYTTKTTKTYLSDYIKSLAGTTQGTGQVVNENGYRYEGKNPNNYIYFNNELWRIIGVFDSSSHGKTGEYLTKIIRNDSLGGYAWDKSNKNNWATSSLYNLLNTNYYNATDGTSGDNCYQYSDVITGSCDYTEIGLQSEYRNMVENVTWYLGGKDSASYTSEVFYAGERDSTSVYSGNTASTTGYIGLMYASDYGYSVLSSSCVRTTNLGSYNTSVCGGSSWLIRVGTEWTVIHRTSISKNSFFVSDTANLNGNLNAYYGYAIRPVLYLKSNVQKINGTGTIASPYKIGY